MQRSTRTRQAPNDGGFTLLELLVVMAVIAILAAVATPVFQKQQRQAGDVQVKSDLNTTVKMISAYWADWPGRVPVIWINSYPGYPAVQILYVIPGNGSWLTHSFTQVSAGTRVHSQKILGPDDWCLAFYNPQGTQQPFRYIYGQGITPGGCT